MPAFKGTYGAGSNRSCAPNDEASMDTLPDPFVQNLFVMRHGEETNGLEVQTEAAKDARPWDPPLTDRGKLQAWRVGRSLRTEDWNITRIVISPFLRCVQTAAEVIAGLSMLPSSLDVRAKVVDSPNFSVIKASIEYGLAEMLNRQGLPYPSQIAEMNSPRMQWTLDLSELYQQLPRETLDSSSPQTRQKLPTWRESVEDSHYRYTSTFQKISDNFPNENILCITHGDGVKQSVSMMWPRVEIHGVTYCAYTHAQRPNFRNEMGATIITGDWELLTESGPSSGVFFGPSPY